MNLGAWPEGVPYDPAGGITSLELEAIISGAGGRWTAVILAADAAGRRTGWAARAAVEIAGAWAAAGRQVILADLCLEEPQLHEHLGAANPEGLADIILFGASLHGAVQPAGERSFEFLPPGPYAPDPSSIYRDDCWDRILAQVRRDRALLIGYAPLEAPGLDDLVRRIGQAILLVADLGAARSESLLPSGAVQLVLRSSTPAPAATLPEDDEDEPGAARRPAPDPEDAPAAPHRVSDEEFERIRLPREGAREQLIAELRQRQRDALLVPPPDVRTPAPESGAPATLVPDVAHSAPAGHDDAGDRQRGLAVAIVPEDPPPQDGGAVDPGQRHGLDLSVVPAGDAPVDPERQPLFRPRSRKRRPPTEPDFTVVRDTGEAWPRQSMVVVTLIVALLLAVLAGAWRLRSGRADQAAPPAAGAAGGSTPAGATVLPYSVAIEAHVDLPSAEARASALRQAESRSGFYITPILVDGSLYYRVMAGPLADSLSAARTMDALVAAGHKTVASEWDIRATPLAFLLGEYGTETEAQARVDELLSLAIPAYTVPLGPSAQAAAPPGGGGGMLYRVYGGGYAGPTEATVMRELLQSTGQPDSLVERMGRSNQ